jgi:type II secretory pathway pseudopilin PulG
MSFMNNAKGFTLIELVVAVFVSMIMLFAIGTAIESTQKSSGGIERKLTAQQDVRAALELMAMEIRMASYNPANSVVWQGDAVAGGGINSCSNASTNQFYLGIQEATANSITVEMDIAGGTDRNGNPDGQGNLTDNNEIISYNYVSANPERYITRGTKCGAPQPFLGDLSTSGHPRTVRVRNIDEGIPIFRYFNGSMTELIVTGSTTGAGQLACLPGCITDIRMIEITLAVETDEIDPSTKQRRRMIYSTREILRNH